MKKMKNNLDERQEQKLLEIESHGCWLAFWGLLAAMVVQMIIYGWNPEHVAGEWVVFMALALYLVCSCAKNGIWDRHLKMDVKTNLILSLIAGVAVAIFNFFVMFPKFPDKPAGSVAAGAFVGVVTFVGCFVALSAAAAYTRKKQRKLEEEEEE